MALRQPNQYSTEFILAACSPSVASVGVAFGFEASHVRIRNAGYVPIRVNLKSTGTATTDDPELESQGVLETQGVILTGLSVTTSSTTTSTDGNGHRVTVSAWGGW